MSILTREEKEFLDALPKALYAISDSINRVADVLKGGDSKPARDAPKLRIDSYKRFKHHGSNPRKEVRDEGHGTDKGTADSAKAKDGQ